MKPLLIWLVFFSLLPLGEAEGQTTEKEKLFSMYPVMPDDAFNREHSSTFEYEKAFPSKGEREMVQGLYRGDAVLSFDDLAKVQGETREIGAVPIMGMRFVLSAAGKARLAKYLSQPNPRELAVFIDGYWYAVVSLEVERRMKVDGMLWIVPPQAAAAMTERLLPLLIERLQSKIVRKENQGR